MLSQQSLFSCLSFLAFSCFNRWNLVMFFVNRKTADWILVVAHFRFNQACLFYLLATVLLRLAFFKCFDYFSLQVHRGSFQCLATVLLILAFVLSVSGLTIHPQHISAGIQQHIETVPLVFLQTKLNVNVFVVQSSFHDFWNSLISD